jgi:hypothetical protein
MNSEIRKDRSRLVSRKMAHALQILLFQMLKDLFGFLFALLLILLGRFQSRIGTTRFSDEENLGIDIVEMGRLAGEPSQGAKLVDDPKVLSAPVHEAG